MDRIFPRWNGHVTLLPIVSFCIFAWKWGCVDSEHDMWLKGNEKVIELPIPSFYLMIICMGIEIIIKYNSFWQLLGLCAGLVKGSIRPKDYIWYGNICPKLYIKKIINKLYMNIKIKSSYIIIQRMAACFLNLDISHHYLSSYYRWRHLNELIPAILQTNKNIAMLSLFLVIGSRERWFAHEWF